MTKRIRHFGSLALIGLFGLTATGCSLGGTTASTKPIDVRVWRLNQAVDPIRAQITSFQKANPKVVVTYFNKNENNYEQTALKSLAARTGPDVWSIPDDWLGDDSSVIAPLPDNFYETAGASCPNTSAAAPNPACETTLAAAKDLYPAGIVEQITSDDGKHIIGAPTNVDALRMYINTDLLSAALTAYRKTLPEGSGDANYAPVKQLLSKPAATWDDVVSQTQYLTIRNGDTITQSGIAMGTSENVDNPADILQLLMLQNGVRIVGTDRQRALFEETQTTPSGGTVRPGENALAFYTSFADPTKSNYTWNSSLPSVLDDFGQGKVAMVIAFGDFGTQLAAKYPKFHPTVTSVPQISLTAPAVNLIKFSVETTTIAAESQAASFAFMKDYVDQTTAASMASEAKLRSPYLKTLTSNTDDYLNQEILTGQGVYKKNRVEFDQVFSDMINNVDRNGETPGAAIDAGAQQINDLLSSTGDNPS